MLRQSSLSVMLNPHSTASVARPGLAGRLKLCEGAPAQLQCCVTAGNVAGGERRATADSEPVQAEVEVVNLTSDSVRSPPTCACMLCTWLPISQPHPCII